MLSTRELIQLVEKAARSVRGAKVIAEQVHVRPTPEQAELLLESLRQACNALDFDKYSHGFSTIEEMFYPTRSAALEAIEQMPPNDSIGFQIKTHDDGSCTLRIWLHHIAA